MERDRRAEGDKKAELVVDGDDLVVRLGAVEKVEAVPARSGCRCDPSGRSRCSKTPGKRSTGSVSQQAFLGRWPGNPE